MKYVTIENDQDMALVGASRWCDIPGLEVVLEKRPVRYVTIENGQGMAPVGARGGIPLGDVDGLASVRHAV
jgi:hypothetical protein